VVLVIALAAFMCPTVHAEPIEPSAIRVVDGEIRTDELAA
jgi:hypothetical protein